MFSFTKKIMIAACMVAFYSGQFYAFGAGSGDDLGNDVAENPTRIQATNTIEPQQLEDQLQASHKPTTSIATLPSELLTEIFEFVAASGESDPRTLSRVCSDWRSYFYDSGSDKDKEASWYSRMNPYGKKLMKIWWLSTIGGYDSRYDEIYERFLNGVLQYRPYRESDEGMVTLKISDLPNPFDGTFDLSGCGDAANYLVITTSLSDFFAQHVYQNVYQIVIGISPHFLVEKIVASTPEHRFKDIMEKWDGVRAPIGIFWRQGSGQPLEWYNYITHATLEDISTYDLFKNWRDSLLSRSCPCIDNYLQDPRMFYKRHLSKLKLGKFHVCF